jgi:hypothetical protein
MSNQPAPTARRGWLITGAIIVVLIILILIIPGVRASVSSWMGLSVAPSEQMPAATADFVAITPQTTTNATEIHVSTQVQSAVSTVSSTDVSQSSPQPEWDMLTPNHLPEGYQFQSAFYDTNLKMLILTYLVTRSLPGATDPSLTSSETISLLQSQRNDFVPMQIAPNTNVIDIQVNGQPAAFTTGGWDTEFVKDSAAPNGGKMVSSWRNDLPVKNLYWQVGKIYLALITTDESVSQQELIDMASSVGK